jgi:ubiquinone/menaquinone biosynthesis C-methylase UbiE
VTTEKKTAYYEELGDKFEAYMSDYDVERRLHLIFSTLIDGDALNGRRVLEIGSGTGRISRTIAERGAELTVVDVGDGLVTTVAKDLKCQGVVGDALDLPFAPGAFDLIISSECIEHTMDPSQAIREMCRVCAPEGMVCLTTPNKLWYPVLVVSQKLGLRKYSGIENWIYPRHAASLMRSEGMTGIAVAGCHLWPFQIKFSHPLLRRADRLGKWLYPFMINFGILGRKHG